MSHIINDLKRIVGEEAGLGEKREKEKKEAG
jgi:hypothetical protein